MKQEMGMHKGEIIIGKGFKTREAAESAARIHFPFETFVKTQPPHDGYLITCYGNPRDKLVWEELPTRCGEFWGYIKKF